jgi:hypothetical protein
MIFNLKSTNAGRQEKYSAVLFFGSGSSGKSGWYSTGGGRVGGSRYLFSACAY